MNLLFSSYFKRIILGLRGCIMMQTLARTRRAAVNLLRRPSDTVKIKSRPSMLLGRLNIAKKHPRRILLLGWLFLSI